MTSLLSGPRALTITVSAISAMIGIPLLDVLHSNGIDGFAGFAVLVAALVPVSILVRRWLTHVIATNATYTLTVTSPSEPHVDMQGYKGTTVDVNEGPTATGWTMTVKVNGGMPNT